MKKSLFIGIDFSKESFDVSVIHSCNVQSISYRPFKNTKEGYIELLKWIKTITAEPSQGWLFCGENTGLYSLGLAEFLTKKGLFIWLENPLQIKQSSGIKREKNDKADSHEIALYAYRFQDRYKAFQLPDKALKSLGLLLSFRERLLANKQALQVSSSEIRRVMQRDATARFIYEQSQKDIERINKEIKEIEKRMLKQIESDERLLENYKLVSSIKGVALINTVAILVATQNFTRFESSRQFACYTGMAPFGKQSGTSIKTKPRVSNLANKKIKALLTQAAKCAIRYDPNIRSYYLRKLEQGKDKWLITNNIRNKMIHRIFAVVRNKQLYQVEYSNHLEKGIA
jgi:Transposase and inactivated derivatives